VVLMRDAASETLTVAAGKKATGNNNAESITIYGGTGTDTIKLASGADVVNLGTGNATIALGGTANHVVAGGGTALVHSTAAFASAAVVGASGSSTTLDITTGGNVTLNAADTYLNVTLEAATTLKLSAMQFISVNGSTGADSLTAASANQTLTGGLGADTLTGYSGGGDSFVDTAAGLNGDTIHNWATGDIIDLKDIVEANLHALSYSGNSTQGTLSVTDGTKSSAIKFAGNLALHNFTVVGADPGGGTLIQWHN
jgi:Ca2+-binding RTX toxin-like protein